MSMMTATMETVGCRLLALVPLQLSLMAGPAVFAQQSGMAGAKVKFVDYQGSATFSSQVAASRKLQIEVDPRSEQKPLTLGVELPAGSVAVWAVDVEVRDSMGRALPVRRSGIEWYKLLIPVPAERATYVIQAAAPPASQPKLLPENNRHAVEPDTGLSATIGAWPDGRKAALSIRFDDSHPTHLSKVIHILREYGFRGTFMVNPGGQEPNSRRRSSFEDHRAGWAAVARRGDQEFANHSSHHRGATGDDDMEREIGDASKAIWDLFPGKSKLLALNLGGGTTWVTTKTLRYYLDKYHLFDASVGSLGMDDVYGNRPAAFRAHLGQSIERGRWCRIHFHAIGEGLGASEEHFRAALEIAKQHEPELWIAGMADIHKYQAERAATGLEIEKETPRRLLLKLSCSTDPQLYDQPLTVEIALPSTWSAGEVKIKQAGTREGNVATVAASDGRTLRFHVPPITAAYVIERTP